MMGKNIIGMIIVCLEEDWDLPASCYEDIERILITTDECVITDAFGEYEERDTCLKNDKDRREKNSAKTIKNTIFEELDLEKIKKETKLKEIHVIKETVKLKQDYLANVKNPKKYNIKGNYLISDEWILGGTSRSYDADWNNVYYPMFADETPDFTELDDYLEEIYPTISFLTYKKIKKECVDVEQYIDRDYYSTTENAYYRCNLEKMFEIIKEMQE